MTNDEIRELLRELAAKADAEGEVKSQTVRINFSKPDPVEEEVPKRGKQESPSQKDPSPENEPEEEDDSATEVYRDPAEDAETDRTGDADHAKEKTPGKAAVFFSGMKEKIAAWNRSRKERREAEEGLSDQPVEEEPGTEEERTAHSAEEVQPAEKEKGSRSVDKPRREKAGRRKAGREEDADFGSDADAFTDTDLERAANEAELQKTKVEMRQKKNQLVETLKARGIGKRELLMICGGIVLLALILVILFSVLSSRRKSAHVTADEGLTITVEKEPASWCRSGTVTLKIRTDSPIQTVSVNEAPTEISGETTATMITLEAETEQLEVDVVTQQDVKHAVIELTKIDSENPQILVSSEEGKIRLDVTDSKSGVDGIWYGIKEPTIAIAAYEPYTEPFVPEEGKIYGYFAKDRAGNVTQPVMTNLTPAEAISLEDDQIALFPGETGQLRVITEPLNAFTNQLVMESANPAVAEVDARGVITAMADGETDITVSAQDLKPVTCHVLVRSEVSFTISAVGDITLGEDVNFSPLNSFSTVQTMYGSSYFFANVKDIFSADDVTFGNFEGTLTTSSTRTEKQYAFRGDPSYTQILKEGSVEAVTLANNHSSDYGEASLTDTQNYLSEAGIEWCYGDKISLKDYNGVKVALIGIYVLAEGDAKAAQVESTIAEAKEQGAQVIVVAFHWGNERETQPDSTQKNLAHLAIESGADLVVGHHPHVLQGIEKYSGKYICYSLGNFCFGGNSNPSDMDTMIFQQTFEVQRGGEVRGGEAVVIPCSISSDSSWNNYQPTPAEGAEKDRIMEKINELCQPFGTSF